ncbi:Phenylacetate-coenzyme A ligase [Enhygromyxa salina]|uniref:Phenylacetate-coenzyme A ligase n=1 Tax=Enhygromyxa salina TaxID=215803 RepID=A0A0C2D198_9BACT|nr:phenylacetate--CoA ligase family protein [Enhygromyxa salina]KIG17006.1 Phenylacetate-coenzyme A ligase [Enhygromyxa salina]
MRPFTRRELAVNTVQIAAAFPGFWRRPFASRGQIRGYQLRRLQALVAHAYANVPLYAELYRGAHVSPRDLQTLEDLRWFPTVNKDDVLAAYPEAALSRGLDPRRCLVSKSSGSSGQVLEVVHQADRVAVQGLAMHRLLAQYAPYRPWHRFVYVYTSAYPASSLFGTYPMILVPTLTPIDRLVERLHLLRPHLLACYPSHLRELANALGPAGCKALGLRAISVSSEPSSQRERDQLAAQFGCGVYDEYSSEELTRIAAQCKQGSYHVFEDVVHLEVLAPDSDQVLAPGEAGEVVGTYLHNFAMPFIRYRQGDTARLEPSRCGCGRTFTQLTELRGRRLDAFVLPSGRVLTSGWLLDATYSFLLDVGAQIAAFRLIQHSVGHVEILLVPGRSWRADMATAVQARFAELVGEPLRVEVRLVDALARSAAGKHQPIISHVHP